MKVLIIMTTKFEISGITNNVMNYYRYLDKSDMKIDFVAPNIVPERLKSEIKKNGGKVFELLMRNKNPLLYMNKLKKVIKVGKYDIVHAHGNSSTLAVEMYTAKKAGVKVRISHSRNTTCKHYIWNKILRPVFNRTYTHGFACGIDAGKWLFKNHKFTVINNGNDINRFTFNEKVRNEYRNNLKLGEKKVLGHVGNFNFQKNHDFIIDTFYELSNQSNEWVLMLVGDGDLKPIIKEKVLNKGIEDKVIFIGQSLEVEKYIQAMDLMILPSRFEGLPNVIVEAQIGCLPSLVSDNVTKEVNITNLVEFLSLGEGPKKWAAKILEYEQIDRKKIKEQILEQITNAGFSIEENAKELKKIYLNLIEGSRK